jgi:hypothetical protein
MRLHSAQASVWPLRADRPTQLDGAHHPPFATAQVTIMGATIRVAVATEDTRHFEPG